MLEIKNTQVTDKDIKIAEKIVLGAEKQFDEQRRNAIRRLDNVDIIACAGSGKTTLMCCKAEILCRIHKNDSGGICVLSHTNVAIDEIRRKLGTQHNVFQYPNYCETIQKFLGEYIFKKWYYSTYKQKLKYIDDELCTNKLKYQIKKTNGKIICALERGNFNFEEIFTDGRNVYYKDDLLDNRKKYSKLKDETWNGYKTIIKEAKQELIKMGIFNYKDIFYVSDRYLELNKNIISNIENRFSYVLIDEVQDIQEFQLKVLKKIFNKVIVQKIGDINQEIYGEGCWNPQNAIKIQDSLRNSQEIAEFARNFEVCKTNTNGKGNNGIKVKFIIYRDENIKKVKNIFIEQIIKHELQGNNKTFKIIGMVAKENSEHITLQDYFEKYNVKKVEFKKENIDFILRANLKKNTIYNSMIYTAYRTVKYFDYENKSNINGIDEFKKELQNKKFKLNLLKTKLFKEFKKGISYQKIYDLEIKFIKFILTRVFEKEIDINNFKGREEHIESKEIQANIWECEKSNIKVQYGTIHSVKGENHDATLVVETFYYKYDLDYIFNNYLFEESKMTERMKYLLHLLYVASTRPKELLCIGMRKETYEKCKDKIALLNVEVIEDLI